MSGFWDKLFGSGAKPIRRDVHVRMTVDEDGQETAQPVQGLSFTLSPDGSIDRLQITSDRFYHCGCNAENPMGGRCGEPGCRRVSCVRCFGRCSRCLKPLCLEHSRFVRTGCGGPVRLCIDCSHAVSRKRLAVGTAKWLLSPFISFGKGRQP